MTLGDSGLVCHHEGRFSVRSRSACVQSEGASSVAGDWVVLGREKEATGEGAVRGPRALMAEILSFSFFYRCGTWGRA